MCQIANAPIFAGGIGTAIGMAQDKPKSLRLNGNLLFSWEVHDMPPALPNPKHLPTLPTVWAFIAQMHPTVRALGVL